MVYIPERSYKNLPSVLSIQAQQALPPMATVRLHFLHLLIPSQCLPAILWQNHLLPLLLLWYHKTYLTAHGDTYTCTFRNHFPALPHILHSLLIQSLLFLPHIPLNPHRRQSDPSGIYMHLLLLLLYKCCSRNHLLFLRQKIWRKSNHHLPAFFLCRTSILPDNTQ